MFKMIEDLLLDNVVNYGVLALWTFYLVVKENQTHKQFMKKLEQLIDEIKKTKK
jgi:hypothetical protein